MSSTTGRRSAVRPSNGLGHVAGQRGERADRLEARPGRRHDRVLVEVLEVVAIGRRGVAGDEQERCPVPDPFDQRRHGVGETGAVGDGGHPEPASSPTPPLGHADRVGLVGCGHVAEPVVSHHRLGDEEVPVAQHPEHRVDPRAPRAQRRWRLVRPSSDTMWWRRSTAKGVESLRGERQRADRPGTPPSSEAWPTPALQRGGVGQGWARGAVAQLTGLPGVVEDGAALARRVERPGVEVPHPPLGSALAVVAVVDLRSLAAEHLVDVGRLAMIIRRDRASPAVPAARRSTRRCHPDDQPQDGHRLDQPRRPLGVLASSGFIVGLLSTSFRRGRRSP